MSWPASRVLGVLATVYVFGALVGGLELGWRMLTGHESPQWPWWGYAIAPFVVGVLYIAAEAAFEPFNRAVIDPDKVTDPMWKRGLRVLALITLMAGLTIGTIAIHRYFQ
jgi:hypothetical protein